MDRLIAMETYTSVVETGSFSGAARRLDVGQSAVSKSIALLEQRLGVRLLLRSTRGITPTEAGLAYYERARRVIEQADQADIEARGAGAGLAGRLRVGTTGAFARLYILPRLKHFLALHPDLTVDLVLDDRHIDLLEAGIDVALRMGTLGDSGMTAQRIARERRVVVGTPAYFAAAGEPRTPADLAAHQVVMFAQGASSEPWAFRRGACEISVAVTGRVSVTAAEGVRAAVFSGLGLAVVSVCMFADELANGTVKAVLGDWTLPSVDLWAVYPGGRLVSARTRAFVAFVQQELEAHAQAYQRRSVAVRPALRLAHAAA